MTIKECIDIVDSVKPNQYSIENKVEWLSFLDHTIINDVLLTHEGYNGEYDDFTGYSPDKLTVGLIVPSPYDRIYTAYLKMKIDEENGETSRYNNSAAMYNAYMMDYKRWYNRTHMPIGKADRRPKMIVNNNFALTDAMYENLRRDVMNEIEEEIANNLSEDRIYDIIMRHVYTHIKEFTGGGSSSNVQSARIGNVRLLANAWVGSNNLYSQVVSISGVTSNSQVDLTPSVDQLAKFYEKDLTFVTENDGGVVTVYAIGQKPTNDYTIQVTITEVNVNG